MSTQLDIPEQNRVTAVYVKFTSKPAIKIKVKKKKKNSTDGRLICESHILHN